MKPSRPSGLPKPPRPGQRLPYWTWDKAVAVPPGQEACGNCIHGTYSRRRRKAKGACTFGHCYNSPGG